MQDNNRTMSNTSITSITPHPALSILIAAAASISVAGCSPSRQNQAEAVYAEAVDAFSAKRIGAAKMLLDSIHNHFADVPSVYRDARDLSRAVARYENERTISFLDSMLFACDAEQQILLKLMVVDDPDAPSPRYISKSQQAYKTFNRSYVKAATDANGIFSLISVFTGERALHHDHFVISVGDEFVEMSTVADDAYRNEFADGDRVWETVRYSGHEAAEAAKFIESHLADRVAVDYLGPKAHFITYLTDVDKEAIAHVWALSRSLRESRKIKGMIRKSRLEMKNTQ